MEAHVQHCPTHRAQQSSQLPMQQHLQQGPPPNQQAEYTQCKFVEAVAAQMQQAITNQTNQETAIPIEITPPSPLQQKFDTLVMCNFTPRKPSELPVSQWVSYRRLFHLFEPYAPVDVWLLGPGNLKQLITEWYKKHSAFAGSVVWCKRLKNADQPNDPGKFCYKFCFEYTPNGAPASNGRSL